MQERRWNIAKCIGNDRGPELKNVEFQTVDYLLDSSYRTKTTDAFILAYVKFEKQMRRLVFYLLRRNGVSQETLEAFSGKKRLEYNTLQSYFRILHGRSLFEVLDDYIGKETRKVLWVHVDGYRKERNKILHGLLTGKVLSTSEVKLRVNNLRTWCEEVGKAMKKEIEYDGLRKPRKPKCEKSTHGFSGHTPEELGEWLDTCLTK
jgi:hypothetical protein